MIPKQIKHENILQAAAQIDRGGVPTKRNSVHYDLIVDGKRYPPKLIITLATKFATGKEYPSSDFNAVEAKNYFETHGYEVIDRRIDDALMPKSQRLVIDLVREAGVDVSDWENFRGGVKRAATNPKYCYEWAFIEAGKTVVLNLWFKNMKVTQGGVEQQLNLRTLAREIDKVASSSTISARSLRMDNAIQTAWRENLPVRVIICEGEQRDLTEPDSKASKVKRRMLDPVSWAVTEYKMDTGDCIVKRGAQPKRFIDQFSAEDTEGASGTRTVTGKVWNRDKKVRELVLERANGQCEYCGESGFLTSSGSIYLETHHVVPLSEFGKDNTNNVMALCPNHHREAHHGNERAFLRTAMLAKLDRLSQKRLRNNAK